jgi:hypothetical protein
MFDDPNKQQRPGHPSEGYRGPITGPSAIARGLQLSTELVAAALVGAAIGWLLDRGSEFRRGG